MESQPNSILLSTVKWDVFGTLTFRTVPSFNYGVTSGLIWLDSMRYRIGIHQMAYYWFLRPELGENGGRFHLHVLLRVPPFKRGLFLVPQGCICVAHRVWNKGMTKFRNIEGHEDPASWYLQKTDTSGADVYEIGKTVESLHGIPSKALVHRANLQKSVEGGQTQAQQARITHCPPSGPLRGDLDEKTA